MRQERGDRKNTRDLESDRKLAIEHLYIKNDTASVSAETLNGEAISPDPQSALAGPLQRA
ncbi:MAG: hypothetical protein OJF51_004216 [Nitrospira sp.]|nr:MAG: hypothetical protein OJF51_004216 [Nitrospira sp.]